MSSKVEIIENHSVLDKSFPFYVAYYSYNHSNHFIPSALWVFSEPTIATLVFSKSSPSNVGKKLAYAEAKGIYENPFRRDSGVGYWKPFKGVIKITVE